MRRRVTRQAVGSHKLHNTLPKRMKTLSVFLAFACACPLLCGALDLSPISTDITRKQADSLYKKTYQYKVLDDISVRRIWSDPNHTVTLDFEVAKDSLVMAEVQYNKPIELKDAAADAERINGSELGKWQRAKAEQSKSIGLGNCYYIRTDDNRFFFIEVDNDKQATSIIYFSTPPKVNRRELEEAETNSFTAMGTSAKATAAEELYKDEDSRLEWLEKQLGAPSHKSTAKTPSIVVTTPNSSRRTTSSTASTSSSRTTTTSSAATATQDVAASGTAATGEPLPESVTGGESVGMQFTIDQILYIAAGIVGLLVLIMLLKPKPEQIKKRSRTLPSRRLR